VSQPHIHRSTWSYINDSRVASNYDGYFAGQNLFEFDSTVIKKWFFKPGGLLDLGCGTGRHLIQFAQRGFDVTGVDLSGHMLAETHKKLKQQHLSARLIRADLCDLPIGKNHNQTELIPGSFDYALCMFSTLGLIYGAENRLKFLRAVRKLLKSTGRFALHVHNRGYNIWRFEGQHFLILNFIKTILKLDEWGDKYLSNYRGIRNMYVHVFSEREVIDLLQAGGFQPVEIIALNRLRTGALKNNFLRSLRANGFLIRAECR